MSPPVLEDRMGEKPTDSGAEASQEDTDEERTFVGALGASAGGDATVAGTTEGGDFDADGK
jgi:hypothetical protein